MWHGLQGMPSWWLAANSTGAVNARQRQVLGICCRAAQQYNLNICTILQAKVAHGSSLQVLASCDVGTLHGHQELQLLFRPWSLKDDVVHMYMQHRFGTK